jgi:hypothetical protein
MKMNNHEISKFIKEGIEGAVAYYWKTRSSQKEKGKKDQGLRSAVTGGAQMDGFISFFSDLIMQAGMPSDCLFNKRKVEIPGYFRPTKKWDLLIIYKLKLIAAIEAKSQVAPSFGNNLNNRIEEATGGAVDIWTAYRERAFVNSPQPFLGYVFMLEDCAKSNCPVKIKEPHFKVFPEFVGASYSRRYEIFCRKLILERRYTAAAFITSSRLTGTSGIYRTPAEDLSLTNFSRLLVSHVSSFI